MCLTRVVNGDRRITLSKLLIGLLYSTQRYIVCWRSSWLRQFVLRSTFTAVAIVLYTYQYNPATNKAKRTFKPRTRHYHIYLACTSVRYERKMHVATNYSKIKLSIVKNLMCFNFVEVWALRSFFYTEIFQIYGTLHHYTVNGIYICILHICHFTWASSKPPPMV